MATEAILPDLGAQIEHTAETETSSEQQQPQKPNPDKGYADWLKSLREDGDGAKFARRAKDDYSRLQQLSKLDPKGLDGVRERIGLIDGLAHGDKKGVEALSAIRESLAESQTMLEALAQGDAESFESLGEDQKEGLLRLAPSLLDRLSEVRPEDYVKTMLPHFVGALRESELATSFNAMVGVLQEQPPAWLTDSQKGQWAEDRMARVTQQARLMSAWFQAQENRLKELGSKEEKQPRISQSQEKVVAPETQAHWQQNVYPQTDAHANEQFSSLLKPWEQRLAQAGIRLSDGKKNALLREFVGEVVAKANASPDYRRQMGRYNSQRHPDAASVISLFKGEFSRHAAKSIEGLIRRDYGQILEKKGNTGRTQTGSKATSTAPAMPTGVRTVSVKPSRDSIDFPKTPPDWIYQNKWRLKNGSVVQYRP